MEEISDIIIGILGLVGIFWGGYLAAYSMSIVDSSPDSKEKENKTPQ